jgi:hypothetical protein
LRKRQVVETDPVFLNVFQNEVKALCLVLTGELNDGCYPRLNKQIADALPKWSS